MLNLQGGNTCCLQANVLPLLAQTVVCTPGMRVEPSGSLFFKPTCIGASSQRTLTLHNTSRVPLIYQVGNFLAEAFFDVGPPGTGKTLQSKLLLVKLLCWFNQGALPKV